MALKTKKRRGRVMRKSESYSRKTMQALESRVHRKVQALVREEADENVPQGNASAAYFTTS